MLTEFHGYQDSVRWRLVAAGVEVEGTGVERTRGAPRTASRVWADVGAEIERMTREYRVPCPLIIATICTESGGRADAVRQEPGYVSDEETPRKISAGLMQTLISTARETLRLSLDRKWLLEPENSIRAGTAYIAKQAHETQLDPPLVAVAYNAGGLYHQTGQDNRWKLRQYPIGTGKHCDRFVQFYNDAVFVLARSSTRPPGSSSTSEHAKKAEVSLEFAVNANEADVSAYSRTVLSEIACAAGLKRLLISSTARTPRDQARVMYDNLVRHGVDHQRKLYGRAGDRVIDVYVSSTAAKKRPEDVRFDMEEKIRDLGPSNVSRHASDPRQLTVVDLAPSAIRDGRGFEQAVRADKRVSYFLTPPGDPAYHVEIPQR